MSRIRLGDTVIYWEQEGLYRPLHNIWVYVGNRVCDVTPDSIYLFDPFDRFVLA